MTEIQNMDSNRQVFLRVVLIKTGKIPEYFFRSFWSLKIGICDLFVIWCLLFGIFKTTSLSKPSLY